MNAAVDQSPDQDVRREVLEHEAREELLLRHEVSFAHQRLTEDVKGAQCQRRQQVEGEAVKRRQPEDASDAAAQNGQRRSREVKRFRVLHDVSRVERQWSRFLHR